MKPESSTQQSSSSKPLNERRDSRRFLQARAFYVSRVSRIPKFPSAPHRFLHDYTASSISLTSDRIRLIHADHLLGTSSRRVAATSSRVRLSVKDAAERTIRPGRWSGKYTADISLVIARDSSRAVRRKPRAIMDYYLRSRPCSRRLTWCLFFFYYYFFFFFLGSDGFRSSARILLARSRGP